jgi:hypothetical protein
MKKVRLTTTIMVMAFLSLTAMSCKDNKKQDSQDAMHSGMNNDKMNTSNDMMDANAQNSEAEKILADYMTLKDALVETNEKAAESAGKKLGSSLKDFKVDSYTSEVKQELTDIKESAIEHAEHISRSEMAHQREHFEMLTKDITDMVAITGTSHTLYQQFCPMYNNNKGGRWLSMEKEIRNPYFGSKMMKCGKVQKQIN